MSEEQNITAENQPVKKKKGNKKGIIIAFIIVLLGINAVQFFVSKDNFEKQQAQIEAKDQEISDLQIKMTSIKDSLLIKVQQLEELGQNNDSLNAVISELDKEIEILKSNNSNLVRNLSAYKERLNGYENLLKNKDKEIQDLKAKLKVVFEDNQKLQGQVMTQRDSIRSLEEQKEDLVDIKREAGALNTNTLSVSAINQKNREKTGDKFRVKDVDRLKITMDFEKNKFSTIGNKTVYIRVQQPDGTTLSNTTTGSGMFKNSEEQEMMYTIKKDIYFENLGKPVIFLYSKGNEFSSGTHHIEIWVDGYFAGKAPFIIK